MKYFSFLLLVCLFGFSSCSPPDFNFDFSGFKNLTKLLVTNCDDIEGQIMTKLGGIQKPSHNGNHIQCADDSNMGKRIKFIIHRDEDDDTVLEDPTRQRLEMYTKAVSSLHASEGSTFVYAWWFNLLSTPIVAAKTFWHIFQIKPSGDDADRSPTLTFSLSSNAGFHVEFFSDHDGPLTKYPIMSLNDVTGKWIQAFVKIHFEPTNGYADITLKNISGNQLFHTQINGSFWWDGAEYYGPKWGLYRRKSSEFDPSNSIFFQNLQIWKQ